MTDLHNPLPKNDAELQAFEDAWVSEVGDSNRLAVIYAPQDDGIWLTEPHSAADDDWEVTLPAFIWNFDGNRRLEDAAKNYLAKLSPDLGSVAMKFKTFESRYPGKVYVVCIDVPSDFDKSQALKVDANAAAIRWFGFKDANKLGEAAMSRENEWRADLLNELR